MKRDFGWNVLYEDGTEDWTASQELCENISSIGGDLSSLFCFMDWREDLIIGLDNGLLRFLDIMGDCSASSDGMETSSSIFSIFVTVWSHLLLLL